MGHFATFFTGKLPEETDYRMASNSAAWQNAVGEKLNVQSAPYTPPSENEIVIKNQAWAVNPIDWLVQENALFDWMKYPLITGSDIAGEVVEVGSGVVRFKKGDRILAMSIGQDKNKPSEGAYQLYSVVQTVLAAPIPDSMSYAQAAVFPLGLCVAACGLFQQDQLALQHPTVPPKPTGKTIIVWGGASSVGSNAIQLAVAGGYEVFSTASLKNFDHLQKLGASKMFDYNSKTVVDDLVSALKNKQFAGLFHAAGSSEASFEVVDKATGTKFVSSAPPIPENKPGGVEANMVWGSSLKDNEVGPAIFVDFLPKALAEGKYIPAPEPWIVGKGLESIQDGFEAQKKGVSAKKVVITV
ncbi:hypothetical protein HO173_006135 [Letharia columbiana]|uniref:Enoyl reductase (ER) domain-containing protein n=1 Tax=Letharia columbiana TaxID=112416 RepID=A0A8H6FV97_9LECA|nr:uncharacterized protein HO173_006135 [Letharia columbiana]KAF6235452.1 hypothetical protein HO173_006135 [Letharia columbiana]